MAKIAIIIIVEMSNRFRRLSNSPYTLTPFSPNLALLGMIVLSVLLGYVEGKETVLIDRLQSKSDKILMKLTEELNSYIEYERYLQDQRFQCKAFLKNDLTKNTIEEIQQLPITLDYIKVNDLAFSQHISSVGTVKRERVFEVDRILDMLNGQCLYYQTSTFIYQYCHKEHVRQFDSEATKVHNAKPEYEDISMGLFHVQKRNARNIKLGIVEPTEEQRKTKLPTVSNFSSDYNFLTVQAIDQQYGDLQFQESSDGNLLHSNAHLVSNDDYFMAHPIFFELHCQQYEGGDVFLNYALVVNPYMLIYTKKIGKCQHLVKHKIAQKKVEYLKDNSTQPIRVYGKYVYGNVQEFCTSNWSWKRKNGKQSDNHLEEGSLLYFQFFNNHTKKIEYSYTIVKRIITSQLIELQHQIGKSFTLVSQYQQIDRSTVWATRFISTVTTCSLLFKKRLNFNIALDFVYLGNSIVRIGQSVKEGDNIGCLCKSIKEENEKVLDLDVVIQKQLWKDHYSVFIDTNTNIYRRSTYMENILNKCQNYRCFPVLPQNKLQEDQENSKFTRIIKISSKDKEFIFEQDISSQYYILNIKDNGLIRLITQKDGIQYTYLLTEGQIIKMVEYANGTKEIIKENKFYENSTQPNSTLYHNYIYIKVNKLPNQATYGGIWKFSDQVYFPRFQMIGEKLIKLERVKGYAYLRVLNLTVMKHGLAIEKGMKSVEESFMMTEKIAQKNDHVFLPKSYSINYTYTSGKYCDAPVNKYRKTIVTMKCGKAWFEISQLFETSPCEYWIEIQTTLLCRQGYKNVIDVDENILSRTSEDAVVNFGVLCHPANDFNDVFPYVFMTPL